MRYLGKDLKPNFGKRDRLCEMQHVGKPVVVKWLPWRHMLRR